MHKLYIFFFFFYIVLNNSIYIFSLQMYARLNSIKEACHTLIYWFGLSQNSIVACSRTFIQLFLLKYLTRIRTQFVMKLSKDLCYVAHIGLQLNPKVQCMKRDKCSKRFLKYIKNQQCLMRMRFSITGIGNGLIPPFLKLALLSYMITPK